jgi:hypothetical protein
MGRVFISGVIASRSTLRQGRSGHGNFEFYLSVGFMFLKLAGALCLPRVSTFPSFLHLKGIRLGSTRVQFVRALYMSILIYSHHLCLPLGVFDLYHSLRCIRRSLRCNPALLLASTKLPP